MPAIKHTGKYSDWETRSLGSKLVGAVDTALHWGENTDRAKAAEAERQKKKIGYRYPQSRHYDRYVSKRAQGPGRS